MDRCAEFSPQSDLMCLCGLRGDVWAGECPAADHVTGGPGDFGPSEQPADRDTGAKEGRGQTERGQDR